ncbi:MAG: hypothetical protein KC561_18725, partial [Myxococcales bacterium]|nr:hypothetical protein [Myxococcales bacterium]
PDAKFILTVRDYDAWLQSAANHWENRPAHNDPKKDDIHMEIRRLLRAAVYGCYDFQPDRFRIVHERHVEAVTRYFADRPEKLLIYPLTTGAGWEPLCDFLETPVPHEPFPHKGNGLTAGMSSKQLEVRD